MSSPIIWPPLHFVSHTVSTLRPPCICSLSVLNLQRRYRIRPGRISFYGGIRRCRRRGWQSAHKYVRPSFQFAGKAVKPSRTGFSLASGLACSPPPKPFCAHFGAFPCSARSTTPTSAPGDFVTIDWAFSSELAKQVATIRPIPLSPLTSRWRCFHTSCDGGGAGAPCDRSGRRRKKCT